MDMPLPALKCESMSILPRKCSILSHPLQLSLCILVLVEDWCWCPSRRWFLPWKPSKLPVLRKCEVRMYTQFRHHGAKKCITDREVETILGKRQKRNQETQHTQQSTSNRSPQQILPEQCHLVLEVLVNLSQARPSEEIEFIGWPTFKHVIHKPCT